MAAGFLSVHMLPDREMTWSGVVMGGVMPVNATGAPRDCLAVLLVVVGHTSVRATHRHVGEVTLELVQSRVGGLAHHIHPHGLPRAGRESDIQVAPTLHIREGHV